MKKTFLMLAATTIIVASCTKTNIHDKGGDSPTENTNLSNTIGENSYSDSLALIAIYKAFNGSNVLTNQKTSLNWTATTPLSKWTGITLNSEGRVIGLSLHAWRGSLEGSIAPEIGQLSALRVIDMEGNPNLKGSIPEELYNLRELRTLRLSYTGITGELSENIGNLSKLDTLDIRKPYDQPLYKPEDEMTGPLPISIAKLTKLVYLDLDNNDFSGRLPEQWGTMENLTQLRISSNQLSGGIPDSYKNMRSITQFSLYYNKLDQALPASLGLLQNLTQLNLAHNNIPGPLPTELANAPALNVIDLNYNNLTGSIPSSYSNIKNLGILWLHDNKLSGTVDSRIASNGRITSLEIHNNNLEGNLPDIQIINLPGGAFCCNLIAHGNRFTGEVPENYFYFESQFRKNLLPQQSGYGFNNMK